MDELERLAQKHRETGANQRGINPIRSRDPSAKARHRALAEIYSSKRAIELLVIMGGIVGTLASVGIAVQFQTPALLALGLLPAGVFLFFLVKGGELLDAHYAARQIDALDALPFDLNLDAYLKTLGVQYKSVEAKVEVTFKVGVPGERRALVAEAIQGAVPTKEARCREQSLHILSNRIETSGRISTSTSSSPRTTYGNRKLHAWVWSLLSEGLAAVHSTFPIERAEITIDGWRA